MSTVAPPAGPAVADAVLAKLAGPTPLKLAEVCRGLLRPKGRKPAVFQQDVREILDDACRAGRAFRQPSGPGGAERYWDRDERSAIRAAVEAAAAQPITLSALKTAATRAVRGTSPAFAEQVVRQLIDDDRLFEHPPAKKGPSKFATSPPPPPIPPLFQPKFKKKLDALLKSAVKLLAEAGVPAGDLLAALRDGLGVASDDPRPAAQSERVGELDELILKAVAHAGPGGVLSLADLRREMPAVYRGPAFDAAVLRLADEEKVRVYQDADPAALSPQERQEYVGDEHGNIFKTIARRG